MGKPARKPTSSLTLSAIQKYISSLEGRDKSIKIIQYSFKLLLYYRWVEAKRWSKMVSHFSQTRKILRVGHCISTIKDMSAMYSSSSIHKYPLQQLATWSTLFITLGNEVADDLYCFYRMGVFGPAIGKKAEKVSIYCWFICIWLDLKSNMESLHTLSRQQQQRQQQQRTQTFSLDDQQIHQHKIFLGRLSCVKLIMDGIFCACDIWEPSFSTGVQAWAGFFSGSLSGYKLWSRNISS
ncbi:peroxisomal biogenesis factor 11 [Absidia repens]|uniref:Peroxisomal biogenesis factor 11 n=1 Tax=Absidia repens TaxID=90262 RepID=A0A1X2IUR4_9FUNG|nr:peroxisomal biogenesis factor 11 [Absidia repens]